MRTQWLALAGALVLGTPLAAQPNPPAGTPQAADPATQQRLDALLNRWENEMRTIQTLVAQCNRTTVNKTFGTTDNFKGTASFMKPNMAMLKMEKEGRKDVFELFICAGNKVYEYVPQSRVIRVHEMPPSKNGGLPEDSSFLSFLFGMKAEEAKRRYQLTLDREDQHYYYVMVLPRFPEDKADFQKARLVLAKQSFLPRELWFVQPNGDEVRWDIPRIDNGAKLNPNDFTNPQTPPGWTMQQVPRAQPQQPNNVPPRVVRPNG
jgi:TIGR03009 family protein